VQAGLEQTNARVFDILSGQRTAMVRLAQQFANDPNFRGYIGNARSTKDPVGLLNTVQSVD